MLRWLPRKLSSQDVLFAQLFALVFCVHVLVMFAYVLMSMRQQPLDVRMNVILARPGTAIAILPFVKKTGHLRSLATQVSRTVRAGGSSMHGRPVLTKAHGAAASAAPLPAKKVLVTKKKPHVPERAKKPLMSVLPAHETAIAPVRVEQAKQTKVPESPEAIPAVVSVAPVIIEGKKQSMSQLNIVQELHEPMLIGPVSVAETTPSAAPEVIVVPAGQPVEVVMVGGQEYEAMQAYQEIHDEVAQYWQPPMGLTVKQPCVVAIEVDDSGHARDVVVEQSSGVLAYDMSARMAAHQAVYPQAVWMQRLRLHF